MGVVSADPSDLGSRAGAAGSSTADGNGYRYRVAQGDAVIAIAQRFGICTADIYLSNDDVLGQELSVGQRLDIRHVKGPGHQVDQCHASFPEGVG
ncbi:LysM domain-containing protein [Curtobacterium sp. MCLR17_044]|uniref:LysM peptidoglycan-binding domain-containing protein n=1 Tax=unclassified Curtobacterium TaxID=257496 RepID=UPI0035C8A559